MAWRAARLGAPDAPRAFAEYLCHKPLFIDVWDGDSLLQLGTVGVELRGLLRQGDKIAKSANEYDIVSHQLGFCGDAHNVDVHAASLPSGSIVGKLQLIVTNFGMKGAGRPRDPPERPWAT